MDENSSSAEEIPFKLKKGKAEEPQKDVENDEDESMDEDEYAVEKIMAHRFGKKGILELLVKWQGYPHEDNTWEPEANLDGCPDELKEYFSEIGGRPDLKAKSSTPKPGLSRKRKLSPKKEPHFEPSTRPDRPRQQQIPKRNGPTGKKSPDPANGAYPEGSWEEHVLNVDTMEKDDTTGKIYVYVVWKNNIKTKHPTEVVYMKCPQKCLQFYEANLQFFPNKAQPAPAPIASMESKSEDISDDEPDESANVGVKGVASSLS